MHKLLWSALAAAFLTPPATWASDQCVVMSDGSAVQPVAAPMPPRPTPSPVPVGGTESQSARRNASEPGTDPAVQGGLHLLSDAEMAKFPAVRQLQQAGYKLFVLSHATGDAPDVFAERGTQFQAIYPTPDPRYRCEGVLKDESGHNVTLDQVKNIPGVLPPPGHTPPPAITSADEALQAMAKDRSALTGRLGHRRYGS